jgi:hypothetical protein
MNENRPRARRQIYDCGSHGRRVRVVHIDGVFRAVHDIKPASVGKQGAVGRHDAGPQHSNRSVAGDIDAARRPGVRYTRWRRSARSAGSALKKIIAVSTERNHVMKCRRIRRWKRNYLRNRPVGIAAAELDESNNQHKSHRRQTGRLRAHNRHVLGTHSGRSYFKG